MAVGAAVVPRLRGSPRVDAEPGWALAGDGCPGARQQDAPRSRQAVGLAAHASASVLPGLVGKSRLIASVRVGAVDASISERSSALTVGGPLLFVFAGTSSVVLIAYVVVSSEERSLARGGCDAQRLRRGPLPLFGFSWGLIRSFSGRPPCAIRRSSEWAVLGWHPPLRRGILIRLSQSRGGATCSG